MHESGLHLDGLRKDILNYQAFNPELLGRQHELVLGKHSGLKAIVHRYKELGFELTHVQSQRVQERLVHWAEQHKLIPSCNDLLSFLQPDKHYAQLIQRQDYSTLEYSAFKINKEVANYEFS